MCQFFEVLVIILYTMLKKRVNSLIHVAEPLAQNKVNRTMILPISNVAMKMCSLIGISAI